MINLIKYILFGLVCLCTCCCLTIIGFSILRSSQHSDSSIRENLTEQEELVNIVFDERDRKYITFIPENIHEFETMGVIFVLHGGGGNGYAMRNKANFNDYAEENGFIVLYPFGASGKWNDGRSTQSKDSVDDVAFLEYLIETHDEQYGLDKNRVYFTGSSNGGMMSYRMACESDYVSAIAPSIANLPGPVYDSCSPNNPIAIIGINGTADTLVPWEGRGSSEDQDSFIMGLISSILGFERGSIKSSEETFEYWISHNNCSGEFDITNIDEKDDGTSVEIYEYKDCDAPTTFYHVIGGGHRTPTSPETGKERSNSEVDSITEIQNFFSSL